MQTSKILNAFSNYIEGCNTKPSMQLQHLSGEGAIHALTEKLGSFYNKKYAVTFCNATTALQTVCLAMNLKNSEIITSPLNWGGSIAPFLLHGNKLRFTSVDTTTLNLETSNLSDAITSKVKAVLSVDYNGIPSDSFLIKQFCEKNGLFYISDSAQSFGAYYNQKPSGYYANVIVLSFSPFKSVYGGEGGAVLTDDNDLFEKLIWNSQHPSMQKSIFGLSNLNEYSLNGRMNPFSAIYLNETFNSSLKKLSIYQNECFELFQMLWSEGNLVEDNKQLSSPISNTFFRFLLRLKKNVTINEVNKFIEDHKMPFRANNYNLKFIPFDEQFRKQYKGRFSCTIALSEQKKMEILQNRIIINYKKK